MGAWSYNRAYIEQALQGSVPLSLVSRAPSSSPAEGSNNLHTFIQRQLIERAYAQSEQPAAAQKTNGKSRNHPEAKQEKAPRVRNHQAEKK